MISTWKQSLEEALPPSVQFQILPTVGSTSTELRKAYREGARGPKLMIALEQTAGRGRQGKTFFSPPGAGLYMTLLLTPESIPLLDAVTVTTAASVGVAHAISRIYGKEVSIKWVNDLYLRDRKVAGILTEAIPDGENLGALLLGIGINLTPAAFPSELEDTVTSLAVDPLLGGRLAAEIVKELLPLTDNLQDRSYMQEYRERSLVLHREIRFLQNGVWHDGYVEEITDSGALSVSTPQGHKLLDSGEISVRPR